MACCGSCVHYRHMFYYNWSSTDDPFVTSMTECIFASDGFKFRGFNCVPCANFDPKPKIVIPFFDFTETIGSQLSLF